MCKETDMQKCGVNFKASITSQVVIALKVGGLTMQHKVNKVHERFQERIPNPVKYLRWTFLREQLTYESRSAVRLLQKDLSFRCLNGF